jgi:leader peptidase (prepilin peptidase)/N-methyltransferase
MASRDATLAGAASTSEAEDATRTIATSTSDAEIPGPAQLSIAARASVGALSLCLGALAFASYSPLRVGATIATFVAVVLMVLAAIDIRRRSIPNQIVVPAAGVVLVARAGEFPGRSLESLAASIATAAVLVMLPNLLNGSAVGMGDVKLGLLLGAALSWAGLAALVVALLCAGPVAAASLIRGGRSVARTTIPLGPFLAFGGVVMLIVPRL